MQAEASHKKSKYEKLNKAFTKKKNSKEETVILYDISDRYSSSSSESDNSPDEYVKKSIAYDLDYANDDKISSSYIISATVESNVFRTDDVTAADFVIISLI